MIKSFPPLIVAFVIVAYAFSAWAGVQSKAVTKVAIPAHQTGVWVKSKPSVISSSGLRITNPNGCETFKVEVTENHLQYKIRCGSYYSQGLLPLDLSRHPYRVQKRQSTVLVYKMGHYGLKVQTGKSRQKLVQMPYVEEVTRIEKLPNSRLSFFREKFTVDDYGRVVRENVIQVFGLQQGTIKVSKNQ